MATYTNRSQNDPPKRLIDLLQMRSSLFAAVRSFFEANGFLEVDAPILTPYPTLDANIRSIACRVRDFLGHPRRLFLHTSPEHAMKKLIAAGADRIYYLGKVFRDGELSPLHNPEFTMVEWYRTGTDYHGIQKDTEALIRTICQKLGIGDHLSYRGKTFDLSPGWPRQTLRSLFKERVGIDLGDVLSFPALLEIAQHLSISVDAEEDWETLFFKIYLERIEPGLGFFRPLFVEDYPLCLGLMARPKLQEPKWVERTELYVAGLELANGYSELTDPEEQRARFIEESRQKRNKGESDTIDWELIEALRSGLPPCAGISLGLDRFLMILMDACSIEKVLPFPMVRMFSGGADHSKISQAFKNKEAM